MKKIILGLIFLASVPVYANTDIKIKVKTDSNLTGVASATYLASKESFFCKEFSMNDGSPRRILKRGYVDFKVKNGVVTIPKSLDSKCKYKRVGGASLAFEIKNKAEPSNVVSIFLGGGNIQTQIINCKKIMSGPSNDIREMISCYGDVRTTENGEATVLILKN